MKYYIVLLGLVLFSGAVGAENLTLSDGRVFENAKISRTTPAGLVVMHSKGVANIPFAQLSKEMQAKYGYNPERAEEFTTREREARRAHAQREQAVKKKRADDASALETRKRTIKHIKARALRMTGKVSQVLDDGLLVYDASAIKVEASEVVTEGFTPVPWRKQMKYEAVLKPLTAEGEPIFLLCDPAGFVDGGDCHGVIYPAGTFRYSTVMGAPKTVKCYSASAEQALTRLMGN